MNNYEEIKNMTVKQMAEFLSKRGTGCLSCMYYDGYAPHYPKFCVESFVRWLEKEAE